MGSTCHKAEAKDAAPPREDAAFESHGDPSSKTSIPSDTERIEALEADLKHLTAERETFQPSSELKAMILAYPAPAAAPPAAAPAPVPA